MTHREDGRTWGVVAVDHKIERRIPERRIPKLAGSTPGVVGTLARGATQPRPVAPTTRYLTGGEGSR